MFVHIDQGSSFYKKGGPEGNPFTGIGERSVRFCRGFRRTTAKRVVDLSSKKTTYDVRARVRRCWTLRREALAAATHEPGAGITELHQTAKDRPDLVLVPHLPYPPRRGGACLFQNGGCLLLMGRGGWARVVLRGRPHIFRCVGQLVSWLVPLGLSPPPPPVGVGQVLWVPAKSGCLPL